MLSGQRLWAEIERVVHDEGLDLFDLDMPAQRSGTLRVYIAQPAFAKASACAEATADKPAGESAEASAKAGSGITVEVCERVSKRISADAALSWVLDHYALEVSSPGINRRLHRREHFAGAVGERVKLVASRPEGGDETLIGKVVSCDSEELTLELEGSGEARRVALSDIHKARVDYLFE